MGGDDFNNSLSRDIEDGQAFSTVNMTPRSMAINVGVQKSKTEKKNTHKHKVKTSELEEDGIGVAERLMNGITLKGDKEIVNEGKMIISKLGGMIK